MAFSIPSLPGLPSLVSLVIPIAYLTILVGSLATFSTLHRKSKITAKLKLAPYFPPHTARNIYLTLLHQSDTQPDLKTVPPSILIAALQERAVEDIMRIREIQSRKGPLNTLLQRGVVGEEIWQRLLRAEQELEAELKDVVAEANALASGWGGHIFQSANEIAVNRMVRRKVEEKRGTLGEERVAWETVREASRQELEGEGNRKVEEKNASTTTASTNTTTSTPEKLKGQPAAVTGSSDEDGVMVETPGSEVPTPLETPGGSSGTGGGGGGKKKKKGKK